MKFYKLKCTENTKYVELYKTLESIGNFIIDKDVILFYSNTIKKIDFSKLFVSVEGIDASEYKTGNILTDEWLKENYRKFRVEAMLRQGEIEKQKELQNLYNVIKAAEEIIDRKEDLVEKNS